MIWGIERVGGSGVRDEFEQNHIPKTFKTIHKKVKKKKSNIEKSKQFEVWHTCVSTTKS